MRQAIQHIPRLPARRLNLWRARLTRSLSLLRIHPAVSPLRVVSETAAASPPQLPRTGLSPAALRLALLVPAHSPEVWFFKNGSWMEAISPFLPLQPSP